MYGYSTFTRTAQRQARRVSDSRCRNLLTPRPGSSHVERGSSSHILLKTSSTYWRMMKTYGRRTCIWTSLLPQRQAVLEEWDRAWNSILMNIDLPKAQNVLKHVDSGQLLFPELITATAAACLPPTYHRRRRHHQRVRLKPPSRSSRFQQVTSRFLNASSYIQRRKLPGGRFLPCPF